MSFGSSSNESQDDSQQEFTEINITPFVDVVLVLLVIFMVTAPAMMNEQLKVNLPKTLTSDLLTPETTVALAITKQGQVLINGTLVSSEQLQERLRAIAQSNPQTHFLVSADVESQHGDLVRVIDWLKYYQLHQFALQVERLSRE
jgi:biopolymer transport protein ExbD